MLKIFHPNGEGVINPDEQTAECQVQVNAINKVNKIVHHRTQCVNCDPGATSSVQPVFERSAS